MQRLHSENQDKTDSMYILSVKDAWTNMTKINQLKNFIHVDKLPNKKKFRQLSPIDNLMNMDVFKSNEEKIKESSYGSIVSSSISYLPKRNGKLLTSSLSKLPIPETALKSIIKKDLIETKPEKKIEIKNQNDLELLSYKNNFLIKYSGNLDNYEKIFSMIDKVSEFNKKIAIDYYYRIKSLTDKKDKIIFDTNIFTQNLFQCKNIFNTDMFENWIDNISLVYEFENYWQKLAILFLKELKDYSEKNIELNKKLKDQECFINNKQIEINQLNDYIKKNDINYKALVKKKKNNEIIEIKSEYEKKEKINIINIYRLEEEIKDLTNLLDKDKEFYIKYLEGQELIESRKKEMDELRVKFNQDIEEKRLKIAILKNDKSQLQDKVTESEKNMVSFRSEFEISKKQYLDYLTQIKILKQVVQEKNENILMQFNEVESWVVLHNKIKKELREKNSHISHLETRISDFAKRKKI